jgi:hypothetical protein
VFLRIKILSAVYWWREEDPFHFCQFISIATCNNVLPYMSFIQRHNILVLLCAHHTKIYPPLPTSFQPISITKTLWIVPTKNESDPPLFTGKLLIKYFWQFSLLPFQSYWTWYDGKQDFYPMSYDNLSSVSQNVLKFYQQLTGEKHNSSYRTT